MSVARSSSLHATLRNDLLFTMSDNLHRVIEDRRDTNSDAWTNEFGVNGPPSLRFGVTAFASGRLAEPKPRSGEGWWSQTESNRRPPACKAGALPTELWPLSRSQQSVIGNQTKGRAF
jgi:hypothetical protein